jgi:cytochrome c biogenesis protein CcmG/thiol:disulfide interchange protein DsbE
VIDRHGRIAFKQVGPITPQILQRQILPLVEKLRR